MTINPVDNLETVYETPLKRIQELEYLVDLSQNLTTSLDVDEVLRRIADGAVTILQAFGCAIFLLENDGKTLTPRVVIDPDFKDEILATPIEIGNSLTGKAIKARQGLIFNDAFSMEDAYQVPDTTEDKEESVMSVPLIVDDTVLGAMTINRMNADFTENDLWLAEAFGRYAAIALKNAQTHQALQASNERFHQLFENISSGVAIYEPVGDAHDFVIANFNAAAERMCNRKRENIIGKPVLEAVPEVTQELFEVFQRVWRTGKPEEYALTHYEEGKLIRWQNNYVYKLPSGEIVTVYDDIGAEKIAEQALLESEEQFRLVSELTSDYAFAYRVNPDFSLEIEWVTGALERISGYSAEELSEKGGWEGLIYPDDLALPTQQFKNLLQNKSDVIEYRILSKDGQMRWMRDFARPEWSEAEKRVTQIFGAVQDITEQKQIELALRESEERFRQLFENSPVAVWTFDHDGRILEWNNTAEQIYGWSADEVVGKTMFELMVRPENVESTKAGIAAVFKGETTLNQEFEDHRADDSRLVFLTSKYPLKNAKGEVTKGICAEVDITERIIAEKQLAQTTDSLLRAQAITHIGNWDWDIVTNSLAWSDEIYRIFGLEPQSFASTYPAFLDAVHPDDRQAVIDAVNATVADSAVPYQIQHRVVRPDGNIRWVEEMGEVQHDETGKPIRMIGSVQDITEKKLAEEALNDSEARLRQAQKMESIGTLAGGVAHDFNNLLTAINGQAELGLMKLKGEHPVRGNLEGVLDAGNRAAKLTSQLLAFSRRQMYQPQLVDINQNVLDVQNILRHLIREDITIETKLTPNLPPISADPHQLEQIMINLVVNARDAIYEQSEASNAKTITIRTDRIDLNEAFSETHPGATPGEYICFCVSDTGAGMDEAVREKIFEPFFTTKPKGRGTGLGLATVYGIVKQNDGNIYVYSEKGRGTTVKIFWKIASDGDTPVNVQAKDAEPALTGTETILLAEDDKQVRTFTADSLTTLGYTVMAAENGAHALQLLAENRQPIDLLVTDVIMPQMDGTQLAETLHHRSPNLPVLFMSGYTDDLLGAEGEIMHNVQFLQKPFSTRVLAGKVRAVLDKTEKPSSE